MRDGFGSNSVDQPGMESTGDAAERQAVPLEERENGLTLTPGTSSPEAQRPMYLSCHLNKRTH